jgi:hypothetical protein
MKISRRRTIAGLVAALSVGLTKCLAQSAIEPKPTSAFTPDDPIIAANWMDGWMKGSKKAVGALHVARFADPIYFLLKPISWEPPNQSSTYPKVTVPAGFVTDFASIPQVFWSALRPDGLYTYPAIIHDYLYWTQEHPKEVADQVLKLGMEDFSVPAASVFAIYESVRLFGGQSWEDNRKLKQTGERRVLTRYPTEPTTTWVDWKKNADVFK